MNWCNLPCILQLQSMSNRLQNGNLPPAALYESLRASQPSSTHSHKSNALFLTQKRQQAHEAEILERHAELNNYIEELDVKVQKIVEHNEAELLFAYRNHLESVRLEMKEFKEETQQALEGEVVHKEKIEMMEKQLIVFREEALKLFQSALVKDKEIEHLQIRLEECRSEKQHMDSTVKNLIKKNKELEAAVMRAEQERRGRVQQEYFGRVEVNSFVSLGLSSHKKNLTRDRRMKDRVLTTASNNNSKAFTQDHFKSKQQTKPSFDLQLEEPQRNSNAELFARRLKMKLSYIDPQILQNIVESATQIYTFSDHKNRPLVRDTRKDTFEGRQTKSSIRSKSFHTCDSNSRLRKSQSRYSHHRQLTQFHADSQDLELKDCFRRCVEVVKKEIARRRQINSLNFFKEGCPISLEDFKKIDFMKLAEMVFANEKVIQDLYCSLFKTAP